jgi:hypothetical protein
VCLQQLSLTLGILLAGTINVLLQVLIHSILYDRYIGLVYMSYTYAYILLAGTITDIQRPIPYLAPTLPKDNFGCRDGKRSRDNM